MPKQARQGPKTGRQEPRTINAEFRALSENSNQVELSFSSEFIVNRWFGKEVLLHDTENVDMSRLLTAGTVLFAHGRDCKYGKVPVARVDEAWLDATERKCKAKITFDDDADSQRIKDKVLSGSIKGVSFGYNVENWEEVLPGKVSTNGRFTGPAWLALRWEPYEISIEPVPADPSVGVGRELEDNETDPAGGRSDIQNEGEDNMPKAFRNQHFAPDNGSGSAGGGAPEGGQGQTRTDPTPPAQPQLTEAERAAAVQAERQRSSEIMALCRDFEVDPQTHITSGATIDQVRAAILNDLRTQRGPTSTGAAEVTKDEADKIREAASDAILLRAGKNIEKPADGAKDLRGMRLRDIAIDCLERAGQTNAHRLNDDELFRSAITPDSQFASILNSSVNKSMSTAYQAAPTTYQIWTGRGSNPDFKGATHYQISEGGELLLMTQTGEFRHDEMRDSGVNKALATYGRKFSISRQALINDDLSILTKVPEAYVRSARRGINRLVYRMLGSNPVIYDGVNLFAAGHGNLAGVAAPINSVSVGLRQAAMRTQQNIRGLETLNIGPKFLLVPAAKEVEAKVFINSTADPNSLNAGTANVFRNSMDIVVDAELDTYSALSWYLAASPSDIDTIEVTYLNGDDMPKLESRVGFDYLGMEWRIYIDYGVTCLDYRGLQMNPGA